MNFGQFVNELKQLQDKPSRQKMISMLATSTVTPNMQNVSLEEINAEVTEMIDSLLHIKGKLQVLMNTVPNNEVYSMKAKYYPDNEILKLYPLGNDTEDFTTEDIKTILKQLGLPETTKTIIIRNNLEKSF